MRVIEVRRNGLHVLGECSDATVPTNPEATVGRAEAARAERWCKLARELAREETINTSTLPQRKDEDRASSRPDREVKKRDRD